MTRDYSTTVLMRFLLCLSAVLFTAYLAHAAERTTARSGKWSDAATWQEGCVPQAGDDVTIRSGHTVSYDRTFTKPLSVVTIYGTLEFHPQKSLELTATGNIVVTGELRLRPSQPKYRHVITFTGVDEAKYIGGGMKVLASDVGLWVMGKGMLNVAGSAKTSWTRLRSSAKAKQNVIEVEGIRGWQVGDRLEIVPTLPPTAGRSSWQGYDSVKITALDGNKVTVAPALQYDHPKVNNRWSAEVLNLTRNVLIQGTPTGRAHIMLMIDRPQKIRNVEIRHMGPRKADGRYTKGVLGRYALHFHLNGEGSRGTFVENVVIHDAGNHAFVPHGSHGIIMRGCVSHNTFDDAFWWDPGFDNRTDDTRWEICAASQVRVDPPFRGTRLTGFNLGQGAGNRITGCVAVGVQGNGSSAGYVWPERPNGKEGIWMFQNNLGHNNKRNGIFTWQNTGQLHVVQKFTMYHNGSNGIEHGAYTNAYFYRDGLLYGNGNAGIQLHAMSTGGWQLKFKNIEIDGAGISKFGVESIKHVAAGRQPTWIEDCTFKRIRDAAVAFTFDRKSSKVPEWFDIVNCTFPKETKRFSLSKTIHPKSLITVEQTDRSVYELRRFDQTGTLVSKWNACRTQVRKPTTKPTVEPVRGKVSENWLGTDGKDWPDSWEKAVLSGAAPMVSVDNKQGLVRSAGKSGIVLMAVKNREARDADQRIKFRISTNIPRAGLFARRAQDAADTFYGAEAGTGRSGVQIFKRVDGKYQRLVAAKYKITANTNYQMRFQVKTRGTVTDLWLKVWKDGHKEPAAWTVELLGDTERKLRGQSGGFGIITTQGGNQGRRVWYDDYRAEFVDYRTLRSAGVCGQANEALFRNFVVAEQLRSKNKEGDNARLPEGRKGIAAKYRGDAGIEKDPNVIFVERFDEDSLDKLAKRWDTVQGKQYMSFSNDVPKGSADGKSLLMTHIGGKGTGRHLYRRLLPGHKQVFARFYVKFAPDCAPIHHFGTHLGGFNPPTPWPQGGAGQRPSGNKRFTSGVEPGGKNWRWDFYTYWQGMHVHGDGRYWGTPFLARAKQPKVERGQWICVEMMLKMNDPVNASNGEQAFWIDGKLWRVDGQVASHIGKGFPQGRWLGGWWHPDAKSKTAFEGFRWRSVKQLAVNCLWTYIYITRAPNGHRSRVWFDNIVVAKKYIGPIQP